MVMCMQIAHPHSSNNYISVVEAVIIVVVGVWFGIRNMRDGCFRVVDLQTRRSNLFKLVKQDVVYVLLSTG